MQQLLPSKRNNVQQQQGRRARGGRGMHAMQLPEQLHYCTSSSATNEVGLVPEDICVE